jgi:hypothetical protein
VNPACIKDYQDHQDYRSTAVTDTELDTVYTHLCKTMTALGEANASLYLARLALLAFDTIADATVATRLIDAAADSIDAG